MTEEKEIKQKKFEFENNGVVGTHLTPSGSLFLVDKEKFSNDEADKLAKDMCNSMYACDVYTSCETFLGELPDLYRNVKLKIMTGYFDHYYGYIFYQLEAER